MYGGGQRELYTAHAVFFCSQMANDLPDEAMAFPMQQANQLSAQGGSHVTSWEPRVGAFCSKAGIWMIHHETQSDGNGPMSASQKSAYLSLFFFLRVPRSGGFEGDANE